MSKIEWTEATWNAIVGCSIVSPGCTNCYAMKMAGRLEAMGTLQHYSGTTKRSKAGPVWTGKLALAPERTLIEPLRRRKPTTYFVNSMGDLFHEDVPDAWIDRIFAVMALAPQHTFQVLTKRAARMRDYLTDSDLSNRISAALGCMLDGDWVWTEGKRFRQAIERLIDVFAGMSTDDDGNIVYHDDPWPLPNVWLGVSAEDQRRADERVPDLRATPAAIRLVSAEPLLGPIDFGRIPSPVVTPEDEGYYHSALDGGDTHYRDSDPDYDGKVWTDAVDGPLMEKLDWIIVGGESGKGARPMHPGWARAIRDQCAAAGTAFFFKQWGEWGFDPFLIEAGGPSFHRFEDGVFVQNYGKKAAGRLLDGVEHSAMPEVRHG